MKVKEALILERREAASLQMGTRGIPFCTREGFEPRKKNHKSKVE